MDNLIHKLRRKISRTTNQYKEKHKLKTTLFNEIMGGGYDQTELNLLLLSHSLEKGMGIKSPKIGFGQEKAKRLLDVLVAYASSAEVPESLFAYNEAMSVLEQYIKFTIDSGVKVPELEKQYQELKKKYRYVVQEAGYEVVKIAAIYDAIDTDTASRFLKSRHSIRSYEIRPVEKDVMESVIAIASSSPSACNRQSVKVFWTNADDYVERISKLIPGNKGFENAIPNWAIITVDRTMFGEQECLQWYLNGGIYTAHLVLAMHAFHIGSCIFQMPISWDGIPEIKKLAGIPDCFAIACAVGFGYTKAQVKCLCTARKPVTEYSVQF